MCNISQTFGFKTNKRAAVRQYNTRYHSTNEEEIVVSYDFQKIHSVITGRLSYGFLYGKFCFVALKMWRYTYSSLRFKFTRIFSCFMRRHSHFRMQSSNGEGIIRQDNGRKLDFHSICWKLLIISVAWCKIPRLPSFCISGEGNHFWLRNTHDVNSTILNNSVKRRMSLAGDIPRCLYIFYTAEVWRRNLQCKPHVKTRNHTK
jgi:hypothetical protein